MSTTKVPNFLVSPLPPSASETSNALDTKLNISDYNTALTSVNNRLDTIEDNFDNYLPLSGSTITGPVYLQNNTTSSSDAYMLTDNSLNAHYGFRWGKGPGIIFRGFNFGNPTAEAGNFAIYARSSTSTNNYILVGRPDGHLMWGTALNSGKEVERVEVSSIGQNGYIQYSSGLQLVWGQVTILASTASSGVSVTYSKAFKSIPRVFVQIAYSNGPYNYAMTEQTNTRSTSGCKIFVSKWNGTSMVWDNGYVDYLAIGHWK